MYAWARRRRFPRLPAPVSRQFEVAPDARVLAHCHWHDRPQDHPTFILLHGLEGSSAVHYMRGLADKAWRRGWNAVLLNQRNAHALTLKINGKFPLRFKQLRFLPQPRPTIL